MEEVTGGVSLIAVLCAALATVAWILPPGAADCSEGCPGTAPMGMKTTRTAPSGWLGHRGIPRPALVRRERRSTPTDGLDCLLAIWIAQAMLESPSPLPRRPLRQEAPGESANLLPSTGTP